MTLLCRSSVHLLGAGVHHKVHQAVEVFGVQCGNRAAEVLHHGPAGAPVRTPDGRRDQRHQSEGEHSCFIMVPNQTLILTLKKKIKPFSQF